MYVTLKRVTVCVCAGMCACHTCHRVLSSAVRKSAVTMGTLKCVALRVAWSKISSLLFVLNSYCEVWRNAPPHLPASKSHCIPILMFIGNQRGSKGVWCKIKAVVWPRVNQCMSVGRCALHCCDCQ